MIELCRCPNLPRPLLRIALESAFDLPMRNIRPDVIGDSCAHLRQTLAFRRNDIVHFASLRSLSASGLIAPLKDADDVVGSRWPLLSMITATPVGTVAPLMAAI